jgi:hypothetical protein
LADQFEIVKNMTLNEDDPWHRGSHVQAFGDLSIQKEFLSEFMGMGKGKTPYNSKKNAEFLKNSPRDLAVYPSQDIPLLMLAQEQKNGKENGMKMQILLKVKIWENINLPE